MTYKIKATLIHIKGHQDNHTSYNDLPLLAQLNVDADLLADRFYHEGPLSTPHAPVLPACPETLSIRGVSITNDYERQLIRAYTEPTYISYIQEKYKWNDETVQWIVWKSLTCGTGPA